MTRNPVLAFDTHAAVVELMEAGMPERQAESVVRLQARLIEEHFATKADIGTVNSAMESLRLATVGNHKAHGQELTAVRQEFTDKLESVRQEFTDKLESVRQEFTDKLESVRQEFTDKLESVRQEFKADLASLKAELIKWMVGTNLAFATLVIAAIKIL